MMPERAPNDPHAPATESGGAAAESTAILEACSRSQAMIHFTPEGTILYANENFLRLLGYTLDEIRGRHHSMFVEPAMRSTAEYREFWAALARGEYQAAEYKRIGKGGREVWIQASYNPVFDASGKPHKIVKVATDVTERKLQNANFEGQIAAINKSQATIEFSMDGTVLDANDNFLSALGYTLDEIRGKHHRMFVDPAERNTAADSFEPVFVKPGHIEIKHRFFGSYLCVAKPAQSLVALRTVHRVTEHVAFLRPNRRVVDFINQFVATLKIASLFVVGVHHTTFNIL